MFLVKKTVSAVLAGTMLLSSLVIGGCSNGEASGAQSGSDASAAEVITAHQGEIKDISSTELVKDMKIGWSLGNTLDGGGKSSKGSSPETIERAWGNPVTTKEMIDEIKNAGFNVLRIPTTWDWSTGDAPDYKISDEWLARVKEVVDYGMANDMYVILNIHHETWHYPTEDNYEAASDRLKKVWTQIGNYFENYDEHLIFEGLNEPRVIGSDEEWAGGSDATREVVNKLDADFVSTIRSLGGNNQLRHLMIPGYAASSSEVALKALKIPENDDKLIVSVHAYITYNFALSDSKQANKWIACKGGFTTDIDNLADLLKTLFIDKGQAVIIGEFGARSKDNEKYRAEWAKYYVTKMNTIGVPCVWWDNDAFTGSGELFGLFDRRTLEWRFPLVKDALISASNGEYTVDGLKSDKSILDELKNDMAEAKNSSAE